ncbi:hypothetical protein N431DRAFT_462089 [Stipitochalara longipes BDJ]|nr:hypothetical protein N431DRAFT_462089 [Stipitochalara longipes BDJ]
MSAAAFNHALSGRLPAKQQAILDAKPLIAALLEKHRELVPPVGEVALEPLSQWAKSVPAKLAAIEEATRRVKENGRIYRLQTEECANTCGIVVNKYQECVDATNRLEIEEEEILTEVEAVIQRTIKRLIESCGREKVVKITNKCLSLDTARGSEETTIPNTKATAVHSSIISACQTYLPGGRMVTKWSVENVCGLIKETKAYISELRMQANDSQQVGDTAQRAAYLDKSTSQMPISPIPSRTKSRSALNIVPSQSTALRTTKAPAAPAPAKATAVSPNESTTSEDSTCGDLQAQLNTLESDYTHLKSSFDLAEANLTIARDKNAKQTSILFRNHQCLSQLDDATNEEYSVELRQLRAPLLPQNPPFLRSVPAIILADDINHWPSRPGRPYSIHYLQALIEDICEIDESASPEDQPFRLMHLFEDHIPWLSTRLSSIVANGSQQDSAMLIYIVQRALAAASSSPSSVLTSSLLLLVANLSQRSEQILRVSLWWDMYQSLGRGEFGKMYEDWDIMERICLLFFLSVNGHTSLDTFNIPPDAHETIYDMIEVLRESPKLELVEVLTLPAIKALVELETGFGAPSSIVLNLTNSSNGQMVILRTGKGLNKRLDREYVWVREGKKVIFSQGGLSITARDLELYICLSSESGGPWFKVVGEDLNYFGLYHTSAINEVAAVIERETGASN